MKKILEFIASTALWIGLLTFFVQSGLIAYAFFAFDKPILLDTDYGGSIVLMVIAIAIRQIKMDYFPSR